jgi:antitoxin YefM
MKAVNYTELRNNLKNYLDSVVDDSDPLIVTRTGGAVVIISLDEYHAIQETEYIRSSPETIQAIRKGEEELKEGKVYAQNKGESIDEFLERISCIE